MPNADDSLSQDGSIDPRKLMQRMMMRGVHIPGFVEALDRMSTARSWEERRIVLERNPVLLTDEAEEHFADQARLSNFGAGQGIDMQAIFGPLAPDPGEATIAAKGDQQMLNLIRRCRAVGIDQAFKELSKEKA